MRGIAGPGPGGHWKVLLIVLVCTLWNHPGQCEDATTGSSAATTSPGEPSTATPSTGDTSTPTPSSVDASTPTPSSVDASTPTTSTVDASTPTTSTVDASTPTTSTVDASTPTTSTVDASTPTTSTVDTSTPTPTTVDTSALTPSTVVASTSSATASPHPSDASSSSTHPANSDAATTPTELAPSPTSSSSQSFTPSSSSSSDNSSHLPTGGEVTPTSTYNGTQLFTSTVPSTTSTVRSTTTTIPRKYKKEIGDMTVPVSLKMKFDNETFTKDLYYKDSSLYKNKSHEYQQQLETVLNNTKGFDSVNIRGFWPGSLGVDFTVVYNYTFVRDNLTAEHLIEQIGKMVGVNETYLNETLAQGLAAAKKQLEEDPCSLVCPLWNCHKDIEGTVQCVSQCHDYTKCQGAHDCVVNSQRQPKCICKSDEKYAYGGTFCNEKTEKLKLPSTIIIAIACGTGGGLIFILSLALLVTCCRKRKHGGGKMRGFDDQKSEVSFQSMTGMQPLSNGMTQDSSRLYRQETGEGIPVASFSRRETGLPADPMDRSVHRPEATRMEEVPPKGRVHYGEDGRLYRVIKDSHLYKDPAEVMAFRNEAFDSFPEETSLSDLGVTKAAFQRRSRGSAKENVYSELSDGTSQTFMYQPSDVLPRSNFPSLTHINPVAATDPDDLSGFSRRDDARPVSDDRSHSGSTAAYSDRWMQDSVRYDEHPGAPVKVLPSREGKAYPTKEPDYPGREPLYPGSRDPGYQTREPPYPAKSAHSGREYDSPAREPPYPAKYMYSGRKADYPAREPPYPAREPAYPARDPASLSMDASYRGPEKEGVTYPKFGKVVLPGEAHEAHNPLIHDFSDRGQGRHQQEGSEKRGPAERARVYDYVPEAGKLSIIRPVFSNKPMY